VVPCTQSFDAIRPQWKACKAQDAVLCCRHLDADEAIVRGAAWYAANLSTTFRLNKKFGMSDGAPYPIVFKVSTPILPHMLACLRLCLCPFHCGRLEKESSM